KKDPRVVNAQNRVAFIKKSTKGKNLLEIGFGDGFTLLESKKQGYNCAGIDITNDYEENVTFLKSQGVSVYNGDFINFQPKNKYDIISAFLLMEHLKYPSIFLDKIKICLFDGGYFVLEVPDVKNYQ